MSVVGSVVAFVTAQRLKAQEEKKRNKSRKSARRRPSRSLRIPVAPPTERHSASKGTGYNRKQSKEEASREIDAGVKEAMDLEKL